MKLLLIEHCNECPFRGSIRGDFHCKKAKRFIFKNEDGSLVLPWWCPLEDAPEPLLKKDPPRNRRSDRP